MPRETEKGPLTLSNLRARALERRALVLLPSAAVRPPGGPRGRRGYHGTASAPSRWSGVGLAVKSNFFLEGLLPACSSWERLEKAILKR